MEAAVHGWPGGEVDELGEGEVGRQVLNDVTFSIVMKRGKEVADGLRGELDESGDEVGSGVEFGGVDPGEVDGFFPIRVDFEGEDFFGRKVEESGPIGEGDAGEDLFGSGGVFS